jgi:hypothetical protein
LVVLVAAEALRIAVALAGWRGMDRVKVTAEALRVTEYLDRVDLPHLERIPGLRLRVDADHVEPGMVVAHAGAALAAEQVEQLGSVETHANSLTISSQTLRSCRICVT